MDSKHNVTEFSFPLSFRYLSVCLSGFFLPLSWIKLLAVMSFFSNTCVPSGQNSWTLLCCSWSSRTGQNRS